MIYHDNTMIGWPTVTVARIFRVSNRTKFAMDKDVVAVEQKLEKVVPSELKVDVHHWLILHGRYTVWPESQSAAPVLSKISASLKIKPNRRIRKIVVLF